MTRQKERLQRVIVAGATPEGIAAANKLGELGIPVTLIDSAVDLDDKLAAENFRMASGLRFNHAHRPGLIRILRNSTIRLALPATITSIKHTSQGFNVRLSQEQTFIDETKCTLCGKCLETCPVTTTEGQKPINVSSRMSLPGRPFIDKRRSPLCQESCPLGVNAQGYIALASQGKYQEAFDLIYKQNVLPGICGRICVHPCEEACRRGELDGAVSIRAIKRFLADWVEQNVDPASAVSAQTSQTAREQAAVESTREEKVAIIGSGPAGIAAAAELADRGYSVTVFEKATKAGGMLRYGIGDHRLPEHVLDQELANIERKGVSFCTESPVSLKDDLEKLQKEYQALLVSTGTWKDRKMGIPGEELEGVEGCIAFLSRSRNQGISELKKKVAVIGDGNSAFDLARVLTRMGAETSILSWFDKASIPADPEEVREALEEGITIIDGTQVTAFTGQDGVFTSLACQKTKPGKADPNGVAWPVIDTTQEAFNLDFDQAFVAIGQVGGYSQEEHGSLFAFTEKGLIAVDDTMQSAQGIYVAGDAISGPSSVVHAMASGKQAAKAIYQNLSGQKQEHPLTRPANKDFTAIPTTIPCQQRAQMPERQPEERKSNFSEVALGLSEGQLAVEAGRCLQCGSCSECLACIEACGAIKAVDHTLKDQETTVQGGVLIVADPAMATNVRGEDVVRAYGPKVARTDINDMMVRGFAAAAGALSLLDSGVRKTKGYGLAPAAPDAGLAKDIRIGVFTCRCNDALGNLDEMETHLEELQANDSSIVHAEALVSACVDQGLETIIKTTREKGLTRIVLASCVCCPLNFVCSACTDQRSRLKNGLFHGTGITRSMVETCNLRGEALRLLESDPQLALERYKGLIHRSIKRAKILKPLPTVDRNYNFTAAVIGNSQATVNCAVHLAESDHDVFHFGTSEQPLDGTLPYANVHSFSGWDVKALSGTIGDFQILIEKDDERQIIRSGTVVLGEKARRHIPYTHQKGLPARKLESMLQQKGVAGIPFTSPCATSVPGLFLAEPPNINVSKLKKGAAAAVMAASALPRGPRQSKGFTVVVDQKLCRGCGRCATVCPYHAVSYSTNEIGGKSAHVDEAICKGCGNCISICPTSAADSPYRNREYLEQVIEELLY